MSQRGSLEGAALAAEVAGLVAGLVPPGMGSGARGKMLVRRVGSGGVEGRGPEVLSGSARGFGGRRSALGGSAVRSPANIIGNIRRVPGAGSENIIANIRRVLGGGFGGLGVRRSAVRRSGGGVRMGGSPYSIGISVHCPNHLKLWVSSIFVP